MVADSSLGKKRSPSHALLNSGYASLGGEFLKLKGADTGISRTASGLAAVLNGPQLPQESGDRPLRRATPYLMRSGAMSASRKLCAVAPGGFKYR